MGLLLDKKTKTTTAPDVHNNNDDDDDDVDDDDDKKKKKVSAMQESRQCSPTVSATAPEPPCSVVSTAVTAALGYNGRRLFINLQFHPVGPARRNETGRMPGALRVTERLPVM